MGNKQFSLDTLGVDVTISSSSYWKDVQIIEGGEVEKYNLPKNLQSSFYSRFIGGGRVPGRCEKKITLTDGKPEFYKATISQIKRLGYYGTIFVRAHEQQHALDGLIDKNDRERVMRQVADHNNLDFISWSCNNDEHRANMGGIVGLKRHIDSQDWSAERKLASMDEALETSLSHVDVPWRYEFAYKFASGPNLATPFKITVG